MGKFPFKKGQLIKVRDKKAPLKVKHVGKAVSVLEGARGAEFSVVQNMHNKHFYISDSRGNVLEIHKPNWKP